MSKTSGHGFTCGSVPTTFDVPMIRARVCSVRPSGADCELTALADDASAPLDVVEHPASATQPIATAAHIALPQPVARLIAR